MFFWGIVFLILMVFWLFGGGIYAYRTPPFDPVVFGAHTLIPWCCVAILGYVVLYPLMR
jgi:hypothetical protein